MERQIGFAVRLVLVGCAVLFTACGGDTVTSDPNFTPDPTDTPGVVGDINQQPAPGDFPQAQIIEGASSGAPLGTNPEFDSTSAFVSIESYRPLDADSHIDEEDSYSLNWSTMTERGGDPDPKGPPLTLSQGERIDLWAEYAVAADTTISIRWQLLGAGLNYTEPSLYHEDAGVYTVKFEYQIPYHSLTGETELHVYLGEPKTASVGIIVDVPSEPEEGEPPVIGPNAGLLCGHFDVDTASYISEIDDGDTDGHIHEYDDKHDVVGVDYFNFLDEKLHNIDLDIPAGTRFKLIIANADLSPGGRMTINTPYLEGIPSTYIPVGEYDDTPIADLPVYSFEGLPGTTQLTELGMYFDVNAIIDMELIPTNTGDVRDNVLGRNGEWRNGSLTIHAVLVNEDGTDGFTTDLGYSAGGVQGVATSGLLWESTLFWHWHGPSYHEAGWDTYDPTGDDDCFNVVVIEEEELLPPVDYPSENFEDHAQMVWEDLIVKSDYDYNDIVLSLHITETRDPTDALVQIDMNVKALARGAGYDHDWQFNMDAAFPGASAIAVINQNYADGTPHGEQRLWSSSDGMSIPIFVSTREALPPPNGQWATNVFKNQPFVDGDYCDVTIMLDSPMSQGTYTRAPYSPQIRVRPSKGDVYIIGLWTKPGDPVDSNGRPLGFIVPDTYAWPQEGKKLWDVYGGFNEWVEWVNDQSLPEPSPPWWDGKPGRDAYIIP